MRRYEPVFFGKNGGQQIRRAVLFVMIGVYAAFFAGCGGRADVEEVLQQSSAAVSAEPDGEDSSGNTEERQAQEMIYVDVCGAVKNPGVYRLPKDARVFQAVALAGGLTDTADTGTLNRTGLLLDGQKLYILTKEEADRLPEAAPGQGGGLEDASQNTSADTRVDLNHASKEALMTLPGIGEAKADAIIASRKKDGLFRNISDIQRIPGIKEKAYEKIKDRITV